MDARDRFDEARCAVLGAKVTGNSGRVAFSGDTGWCDNLPRLAEDVGVFVCEATLSQPDTSGHGHLCGKDAGRAAAIAKPKNLLLTHFHSDAPSSSHSNARTR